MVKVRTDAEDSSLRRGSWHSLDLRGEGEGGESGLLGPMLQSGVEAGEMGRGRGVKEKQACRHKG